MCAEAAHLFDLGRCGDTPIFCQSSGHEEDARARMGLIYDSGRYYRNWQLATS